MSKDVSLQRVNRRIDKYHNNVLALPPDTQQKLHNIGWDMVDSTPPIQPSPKEVQSRLYPGVGIGSQGLKRRRKLCKAQQTSIMRSRAPLRKRRQTSFSIRQRLTPLLTCSIATLRRARA